MMNNPFPYAIANKRYKTIDYALKQKYQSKVAKVSLNGGFSCPNRDGKISKGGCIFCSNGSGDDNIKASIPLMKQFEIVKNMLVSKWGTPKYIAYFQSYTNTYASVDHLKEIYEQFVNFDDIVEIYIATRPDCLDEDVLNYLSSIAKRKPLTIELGFQTANENTAKFINRGYPNSTFIDAVKKLRDKNIDVVVHIINGLPGETKEDNINTIKFLNKLDIQGIKFHSLFIEENTTLAQIYQNNPFNILSMEEYIDIVISQLELINPNITIGRVTGDPYKDKLIEPKWALKKINVMNGIDKEMAKRNTYQGRLFK